jgi:predicted transcriptional regulator with HTH domain
MQTEQPITEAIVIHPYLYQKFMKQAKNFHNLIALYLFYIHNAQLQKTNQILATDEFVHKGLGWGLEKIKKIKAILKKLGVIEMVRKGYYSYIKLIYIYSRKKIEEILNPKEEAKENEKNSKIVVAKEPKEKSAFQLDLEKNGVEPKKIETIRNTILKIAEKEKFTILQPTVISKWIIYCENNGISYNETNIAKWLKTLNNSITIEQLELVEKAIAKGWKSIYPISAKESKYQKFLGRSIKYNGQLYEKLENILIDNGRIFYIFKDNKQISTQINSTPISRLFEKYEFVEEDSSKCRDVGELVRSCFTRMG